MDFDLPDDVIARQNLFTAALTQLAIKGNLDADKMLGPGAIPSAKRDALIGAAIQPDDVIARRLQPAFPGIDILKLITDMRIEAMIIRLGGMDEP